MCIFFLSIHNVLVRQFIGDDTVCLFLRIGLADKRLVFVRKVRVAIQLFFCEGEQVNRAVAMGFVPQVKVLLQEIGCNSLFNVLLSGCILPIDVTAEVPQAIVSKVAVIYLINVVVADGRSSGTAITRVCDSFHLIRGPIVVGFIVIGVLRYAVSVEVVIAVNHSFGASHGFIFFVGRGRFRAGRVICGTLYGKGNFFDVRTTAVSVTPLDADIKVRHRCQVKLLYIVVLLIFDDFFTAFVLSVADLVNFTTHRNVGSISRVTGCCRKTIVVFFRAAKARRGRILLKGTVGFGRVLQVDNNTGDVVVQQEIPHLRILGVICKENHLSSLEGK